MRLSTKYLRVIERSRPKLFLKIMTDFSKVSKYSKHCNIFELVIIYIYNG